MDERIVYGARCVWWGSISEVAQKPSGLPCCPKCGGVLMEVENETIWWDGVDRWAIEKDDPEYRGFIEWLRGRCFARIEVARAYYDLRLPEVPDPA